MPFEDVYARWSLPVFRFCVAQVRQPDLAEDLAAETFKLAYAAYNRTAPDPATVQTWLFRIARNVVIDHHRRNRRWLRFLDTSAARAAGRSSDIEADAELRGDLRQALAALDKLGERDRAILGMRMGAELSLADIAKVLGIGDGAAGVAVRRALERWRKAAAEERG